MMKKHSGITALLILSSGLVTGIGHAGQPGLLASPTVPGMGMSMFAEYSTHDAKLDSDLTLKLKGGALGVSNNPALSGGFGRVDYLTSNQFDVDYYELQGGGQFNLLNAGGFYVLATAGLGFAGLESSRLANSVSFVSLPIGLEAGFSPIPSLSLYAGVGYKWLLEITDKTTCKDGTTTNSTGQGACSYHSGIDYYNETIGDMDGVAFRAGLRMNF
jgi:hypothetical protein